MAQLRNNGSDEMANLRAELGRVSEKVAELVRGQSSNMREAVDEGREALNEKAREWSKAGASVLGEAQDRMINAKSDLEARIERHPFAAILVAVGIGMVFGLMKRERR